MLVSSDRLRDGLDAVHAARAGGADVETQLRLLEAVVSLALEAEVSRPMSTEDAEWDDVDDRYWLQYEH